LNFPGCQVFNDPDVKPYSSYPSQQLVPPGGGLKIDPTASYLFLSNGSAPGSYFSYPGSQNIIKVSTGATLDAMPHWVIYE
jgi:hypothetical protein